MFAVSVCLLSALCCSYLPVVCSCGHVMWSRLPATICWQRTIACRTRLCQCVVSVLVAIAPVYVSVSSVSLLPLLLFMSVCHQCPCCHCSCLCQCVISVLVAIAPVYVSVSSVSLLPLLLFQFPSQIAACLQDPLIRHLVAYAGSDVVNGRLSYWLSHCLNEGQLIMASLLTCYC